MVEIDRTKPFRASFMENTKVPVLTEFDIFTHYHQRDFRDPSLYVVRAKTNNLFLNKEYNLVNGKQLYQTWLQKNMGNTQRK